MVAAGPMALTALILEFCFHCSDLTKISIAIPGPRAHYSSIKNQTLQMNSSSSFFLAKGCQIQTPTKLLQNKMGEGKKKWTCAVQVQLDPQCWSSWGSQGCPFALCCMWCPQLCRMFTGLFYTRKFPGVGHCLVSCYSTVPFASRVQNSQPQVRPRPSM